MNGMIRKRISVVLIFLFTFFTLSRVYPIDRKEESDALALTRFKVLGNEKAGNVLKTRKIIKQNSFLKKFDSNAGRIYGKFLPSARSGRCTSKDQNLQQLPRSTKSIFGTITDGLNITRYRCVETFADSNCSAK